MKIHCLKKPNKNAYPGHSNAYNVPRIFCFKTFNESNVTYS